jgi:hypothetical protein
MQRPAAPRRGRWSQAEINRLRELYGLRDEAAIAHELNRPEQSVRKMAEEIFGTPTRTGPWSAEEVQELRRYIGGTSTEVIARKLGRSAEEVAQQIGEMRKIQQVGRWSQEEIADFKRLYGTRTDDDLALIFGRTLDSVQRLAERYRLAKDKAFVRKLTGTAATRMPRWDRAAIEQLKELYPKTANLDLALKLNRSVKSIVSKAHNLGLKKQVERLREMGRENVGMRYKKTVVP